MIYERNSHGFSLLEILVSLFVVSMTATQIASLQKLISEQSRDHSLHVSVLQIASEKMEEVLQYDDVSELNHLVDLGEIQHSTSLTNFTLKWEVSNSASMYDADEDLRSVSLHLDWVDSQGEPQRFIYSKAINGASLLNAKNRLADLEAAIIESFIATNDVLYFDAKSDYKTNSFIIYNSELFSVTSADDAQYSSPRSVDRPNEVAEGWQSYGLINNPALANIDGLVTLHKE